MSSGIPVVALIQRAHREGWAAGQFNMSSLDTLHGIIDAANATRIPCLVGLSLTTLRYVGPEYVAGLVPAARNQATVPLYFHLDHGADLDDVLACSFGNKPAGGVGIGTPDRGLFARIGRASPVPLVVHGGTSLTDDMIRFAIGCGTAKVNIDTWIRRAVTQTLARCYAGGDYPADPRLSFKQVRAAARG